MRNIEILFKSGQRLFLEIEDLLMSVKDGVVTKLEWKDSNPSVIFINPVDISAIIETPPPNPDGGYG